MKETVVTADSLNSKDLAALAEGAVLALRLPKFYPAEVAEVVSDRLLNDPGTSPYPLGGEARSIQRWGLVYLGSGSPEAERYRAEALTTRRAQRQLCRPFVSPIDLLKLELQDVWPSGAIAETFDERPTSLGFARIFIEGVEAKPHIDDVRWATPNSPRAACLLSQIAANVHLRSAKEGGELQLWSLEPDIETYGLWRQEGSYGLDRSRLPPPTVEITAQVGELILFRSTCIHAVCPVSAGVRVAFSCSVGYHGPESPLTYWS